MSVGETPDAVRIAPDGGTLVVANRDSNSVSVVDAKTLRLRATFAG